MAERVNPRVSMPPAAGDVRGGEMRSESMTTTVTSAQKTTSKKTLCRICTAQCPIVVEVDESGRPVSARGDKENPHSEGFFCLKGKHFPEIHTAPSRLRHSLARDASGVLVPIDAERAMDEVAIKLQKILDQYGLGSLTR